MIDLGGGEWQIWTTNNENMNFILVNVSRVFSAYEMSNNLMKHKSSRWIRAVYVSRTHKDETKMDRTRRWNLLLH